MMVFTAHMRREPGTAAKRPAVALIALFLCTFALAAFTLEAKAEEASAEKSAASKADEKDPEAALPLPPTTQVTLTPAEQYCSNVLDAANAAQLARQTSAIQKAEKELDARVALLASKSEELKGWIKLREDFTKKATDQLIQIYGKMKPEAAAGQLAVMDEMVAAAIMSKLQPKISSLIMAEMQPPKAARLSAVIAGSGEIAMKPEHRSDAQ